MVLGQETDPEPDLAVVAGRPRDAVGHPTTADLVVEVADSWLSFDTTDKRLLYAGAGIREYLGVISDAPGRQLLVYRDPQAGDYVTQQVFGPVDSLSPLAARRRRCRISGPADVIPLLPRRKPFSGAVP